MSEIRKLILDIDGDGMLAAKYSMIKNLQSNIVREHDLRV